MTNSMLPANAVSTTQVKEGMVIYRAYATPRVEYLVTRDARVLGQRVVVETDKGVLHAAACGTFRLA